MPSQPTVQKRKNISSLKILSLIISILPLIIGVLNDPDSTDVVSIDLERDPKNLDNVRVFVNHDEKTLRTKATKVV